MEKKVIGLIKKYYAAVGLLALLLLVVIPAFTPLGEPSLSILRNVGLSLFATLTVSYFVNLELKEVKKYETEALLNEHFPKLMKYERIGLNDVVYENNTEALGIDIVETNNLFVIMNDGKNFFTNNSKKISERFKKPNKTTIIVLLNYDSESIKILNERNGKTSIDYYSGKVHDCIQDYKKFHKNQGENNILKIFLFDYAFNMSIVATDEIALIGLYRNASGKALVPPQFIFKNNGGKQEEYANIRSDIDRLIQSSKEID